MTLIPSHIRRRIIHRGDVAQLEGFQDLFILLNLDPDAEQLRRLTIDYFKSDPFLRDQLGSYMLPPPSPSSTDAQASSMKLVVASSTNQSSSPLRLQAQLGSFFPKLVRSTEHT